MVARFALGMASQSKGIPSRGYQLSIGVAQRETTNVPVVVWVSFLVFRTSRDRESHTGDGQFGEIEPRAYKGRIGTTYRL